MFELFLISVMVIAAIWGFQHKETVKGWFGKATADTDTTKADKPCPPTNPPDA